MLNLEVERAALVALLFPPRDFKWAPLRDRVLEEQTFPADILEEKCESTELFDFKTELQIAHDRIVQWQSDGTRFSTYLDADYPQQLREAHDLPPFLFGRGHLLPRGTRERGVSIVGSRNASDAAIECATDIANHLVHAQISIISGLAAGIDYAAHTAALEARGRTVGIIGTGIDRYYPRTSASVQRRMESGEGAVLSQFWPGASPSKISFPMRNAVMSAYSRATVIVEATEKSGTRHQAFRAVRHGRPLILLREVAKTTTWGLDLSSNQNGFNVQVADNAEHAAELAVRVSEDLKVSSTDHVPGISEW